MTIYNGRVILRKLTEKSYMDIKGDKVRVREAIEAYPRFLRSSYFNKEEIDFIPDVLEKLHITEEFSIDKPGKNPYRGKKLEQKLVEEGLSRPFRRNQRKTQQRKNYKNKH